ncbi:hypothetical protein Pla108_06910 [Botrimarina colliarenosi]|uniref:Uncharacterized protein n=1 Tax=Botrimarina colliarenosi TaxID=2528001 RepID=A0A5C6AKG8_9BACT|nr:hypothetical protein [Botrimarina colliarenosi]TWT99748.1 hypothetical protein Pla108_06910 [Botrimarina colliarenosi]
MAQPFLERLDATAARLRGVARQATACWTAATAIGVAALLVLIDWLGRFNDPGLRWVFSLTLIGATVGVAIWAWRRLGPTDATRLGVAQRLQRSRPDLGSRLASAVEFAASDAADRSAGSEQLRRAVVLDASKSADSLPFDAVVDRTPLRQSIRWLLAAIASVAVLALAAGPALGTGLYRLAAPWADAPWPRLVTLRAVDPPTTLARGATFEATAVNETGPLPDEVRVEYRFAAEAGTSSRRETAPAQLVGDQAVATRDRVQRSFSFRFVGGDDDTMAWNDVAVLDPPVAEAFAVTVAPPAYSGLPPSESTGPLRILAGTTLSVSGSADKPLSGVTIELPGEADPPDEAAIKCDLAEDNKQWTAAPWEAQPTPDASSSLTYEVRLEGESGVVGVIGPHRYEVVADQTPQLKWRSTDEEDVVTARAVLSIAGEASDDLALQRIEIEWSPPAAEGEQPAPQRVVVAERGAEPPARKSLDEGDQQPIAYDWDLEPLGIDPGTELSLWLTATDYLPQEGRTATPRRLTVVTDEEYQSRLAERQSRLLGQVQQALATQRDAAGATRDLDADARDADAIDRAQLDRLTSVEFQQREAAAAVDDPTLGATAAAERLLEDLRRSRLDAPDLDEQLAAAGEALRQLGDGAMPAARGELASARRAAQRATEEGADPKEASAEFQARLADAEGQQAEAIDRLEQVADLLTSWADFQRFAGEAAAIEKLERDLANESQRQAAAAASKLFPDPTQAERDKLLTGQAEAARRFDKLRSAMQRLLASQPAGAPPTAASEAVADALAEADDADVPGKLRDASRDLARGRLGTASQAQRDAADGLKAMLEALRQRTTTDPKELAKRLTEEKQKLAEIQKEVEQLKQRPDTRQTEAARQQAASRAARLGRRLQRLTAPQASASASQGAQQTSGDQQPGEKDQQLAEAQQSFDQAQREIDQRIRELENQQTQRLLDQLAARIGGYIERQDTLLDGTLDLERAADQRRVEAEAPDLAVDERDLADELSRFAEELGKRAVFELALGGAAEQTEEAATRLEAARVDSATQRLEKAALARLRHIEEVLRQTPPPPQENQPPGGGGEGGGGQPPPPSPIDVAELKMLRLMQLEVLTETDAYEADTATARRSGKPLPPEWSEEGQDLAKRQQRLAELALELSERDNDPEAEADEPE